MLFRSHIIFICGMALLSKIAGVSYAYAANRWSEHESKENLYFTEISVKDGLSQGIVYCIARDRQGFMWFGTGAGINRYDGYEFRKFKHDENDPHSISDNLVNCIVEGNDALWIGTGNGLNRFDPRTDLFTCYFHDPTNEGSISDNYVKSLFIDSRGDLWVGVDGALNRYDREQDRFNKLDFDGLLIGTRIYSILEDYLGMIWLATRDVGLICFDPKTLVYKQYLHDPSDPCSISSNHVYYLYENRRKELWVGTWEHGVNIFNHTTNSFRVIRACNDGSSINSNQIRCLAEDMNGRMWIGTFEGINIYDPIKKQYSHRLRHNNIAGTLSNNIVNCIYPDKMGSIWLGTNGGGIDLYNPVLGQFRQIDPKIEAGHDYGYIGPMIEYDGAIWIGTEGGGLASYDLTTKKYTFYDARNPRQQTANSNTIKALCADRNGMLWIGTYAAGIQTFNPRTRSFEKYYDTSKGINNNIINELFEDSKGNVWVGSNNTEGLHIHDSRIDQFVAEFEIEPDQRRADYPWIRTICERKNGELWMGSIYHGIFIHHDGGKMRTLSTANSALSSDFISFITEDSRQRLWIGTYGGGVNVYDPETERFSVYDTSDGLLNDNVCSIVEDSLSRIWISTMAGLSAYDPVDSTFTNYSAARGNFPIETLNLKSGLYASDGNIYFGGSNGIAWFSPRSLHKNRQIPPVVITGLTVDNRPVRPADQSGVLDRTLQYTERIVLNHRQTDISIEFAALDYIHPQNNQYSFRLEGYDKAWSLPGYQRQATYTNLPDGEYFFRIRASNDCGVWNDSGAMLSICILPPPWRTWWAYCLYILSIVAMLYVVAHYTLTRIKLQNDIRLNQLEKATMEETHRMQLNLFTNFSHELRTPLTLILDPLKNLLASENFSERVRQSLELIYRNACRILTLVDQLMDFRKQESGQLKMHVSEGNLVQFTNEMVVIFKELTLPNKIRLLFHATNREILLWFDPFLMEKIYFNILSNAVKNTPVGGTIQIAIGYCSAKRAEREIIQNDAGKLTVAQSYVEIIISNTGTGIPETDLKHIFAPFYRVDEQESQGIYGTGIGLHLTKSIVRMHHGVIWAESIPNRGATFKIILPCDKSLFDETELVQIAPFDYCPKNSAVQEPIDAQSAVEVSNTSIAAGQYTVLVIDDNAEIRSYIADYLRPEYNVYEADNGMNGLQKAQELMPDLVISDIMMPKIDGLELSRLLKQDIKTSHIPIILLTARTTIRQAKEGLQAGADDYVTKPFDAGLLKSKVESLIENRRRLKEAFIKSFSVDLPDRDLGNANQQFLTHAYDYVKANIADGNLSIEHFGRSLHLSRTQLYRKIKVLTGMSPSLFVSTLRLKVAASLLTETKMSVSEVAYKVGFNSPSYFTTSFKKLYGVSPKEYSEQTKM